MGCIEYTTSASISTNLLETNGCFLLIGSSSSFSTVVFSRGVFQVELWGSSAGKSTYGKVNYGGLGGYTSGFISVHSTEVFYFFIGTSGTDSSLGTPGSGGYNGGSVGGLDNTNNDCASGGSGGSTDMRLITDDFGHDRSLLSRIMVAGGGASSGCYNLGGQGGHGGGITGSKGGQGHSSSIIGGDGGSQTSGYQLLQGQRGFTGDEAGGSGGGGYWGGFGGIAGQGSGGAGGGGGSSYVSGHSDCISLDNQTQLPLGTSKHPSLFTFDNAHSDHNWGIAT